MTRALAILEPANLVELDLGEPVVFLRGTDGKAWATSAKVAEWLGFSASHFSRFVHREEVAKEVQGLTSTFRLATDHGHRRVTAYSDEAVIRLLLLAPTDRGYELRGKIAARALTVRRRVVGSPVEQLRALLDDARDEAKAIGAGATTPDERGTFADADDLLGEARQVTEVAGALAGSDFAVPLGGYGLGGPVRARATFLRLLGGDDHAEKTGERKGS